MKKDKILRVLFIFYLTFFSVQFALAQEEEEEEEEEQTESEKKMEKKEQEMENFMNAFEKSVVNSGEENFGDPAEDSIKPAPANFIAFKKLIDKTVSGLENSLPAGTVATCKAQRDNFKTSGKIGEVSVINLLQENTLSSVLLSGYAVQADYEDVNAISCFGSVLNICGHPSKSIPILEYSASVNPNLNTFSNLGDAYRRMGNFGQAQSWLKKAIQIEPYEIDANLILGQIAMKNGQKRQAADYLAHSLQGGYTSAAEAYLKKIKKELNEEVDIGEILLETHKREPLSEVLQISCIEMPTNVSSIKELWIPNLEARLKALDKYIETLQTSSKNNVETMISDLMSQMDNRQVKTPKGLTVSCQKSYLIVSALFKHLSDSIHSMGLEYGEAIGKLDREREKDMSDLQKSYIEALKSCTGSSDYLKCENKVKATYCQLVTTKLTTYLMSYASIYEKFCSASFSLLTDYYNHGTKWAYTAYIPDQREFGIQASISMPIAGFVREITALAYDLAKVDASSWCPEDEDDDDGIPAQANINLSVLPVFLGDNICTDIKVPLFIGSFQVDCKGWAFEIEVATFSMGIARESDTPTDAVESIWPVTNRTTVKVGLGLPTTIPDTGTGFKFEKSVFVTVDDNMTVSDVGMIHETGLTAGGLAVGRQEALKIGTVSGGTFIDSEEGEKKLFAWKDLTE